MFFIIYHFHSKADLSPENARYFLKIQIINFCFFLFCTWALFFIFIIFNQPSVSITATTSVPSTSTNYLKNVVQSQIAWSSTIADSSSPKVNSTCNQKLNLAQFYSIIRCSLLREIKLMIYWMIYVRKLRKC